MCARTQPATKNLTSIAHRSAQICANITHAANPWLAVRGTTTEPMRALQTQRLRQRRRQHPCRRRRQHPHQRLRQRPCRRQLDGPLKGECQFNRVQRDSFTTHQMRIAAKTLQKLPKFQWRERHITVLWLANSTILIALTHTNPCALFVALRGDKVIVTRAANQILQRRPQRALLHQRLRRRRQCRPHPHQRRRPRRGQRRLRPHQHQPDGTLVSECQFNRVQKVFITLPTLGTARKTIFRLHKSRVARGYN